MPENLFAAVLTIMVLAVPAIFISSGFAAGVGAIVITFLTFCAVNLYMDFN